MPNFYSQFGEDVWIAEKLHLPALGTFCEVGAFDGRAGSNTLFLEELGWHGILVEPDPEICEICRQNRSGPVVQAAVALVAGFAKFKVNADDRGTSGLVRPSTGREIVVPTVPLSEIFSYLGTVPDLLSIDTEGTELECWESCGEARPRIVILEYLTMGSPSREAEIRATMERCGYVPALRTDANLVFATNHYL